MNRVFYILFFLAISNSVVAQQSDTVKIKSGLTDSLRSSLNKINALSEKDRKKVERINSKLERQARILKSPGEAQRHLLSKSKSFEKKISDRAGNLNPQHEVDQYNQKVALLRKYFNHHLDSLNKLSVKDARVTKSMDSLKRKIKHLKNARSLKDVKKGEVQLAKLQSGLSSKVQGFEAKMNKELSALGISNKLNNPNLNVPNLNVPNVNLPGVSTNLHNTNLSLPNVSMPAVGSTNVPNVSLPNSSQANIPGVGSPNITNNVLPSGQLSDLEKEAGQLTKASGEITKAQGEMKNLNPDKLESSLESEAKNMKGVRQLSGEAAQAEQYKKMVEKWQSDPDYQKEMAVSKAKEQVINHFAGQEQKLQAAMQQLSNVKKKYKDYEGTLDMFKKPGNAMKGKPFIERLRPGFNIQIQSRRKTLIDFNPQVGYRISGKLTAGIGWNERWGYDFSHWNYYSQDHIYGPRAYAQVRVKTGIYALIAPEVMNALVPPTYSSPDPGTKKWVWSWMAGMKKEFRYSKNLLGSMQVMYNLLDKHNQSPYVSKLNIRMGFEFSLNKKKR